MRNSLGRLGDRLLGRIVPQLTAKANMRPNVNCHYCGPCTVQCPGGIICCDDGTKWCAQN